MGTGSKVALIISGVVVALFGGCAACTVLVVGGAANEADKAIKEVEAAGTAAATGGVFSDSLNVDFPPQNDVKLVSCKESGYGSVKPRFEITNNSPKRSNYYVSGTLLVNGTVVGSFSGSQSNVEPGQKAEIEGFGSIDGGHKKVACEVKEVQRYAS